MNRTPEATKRKKQNNLALLDKKMSFGLVVHHKPQMLIYWSKRVVEHTISWQGTLASMTIRHSPIDTKSLVPIKIEPNLSYDDLLCSYTEATYNDTAERLMESYGLKVRAASQFKYGIKALIKGREFDYAPVISAPTRIFMLLHTLGHYQFITRAARRGISRYDYIYETSEDRDAHVYRYREVSDGGPIVTQKILDDRIEFEVRANDFAVTTAARLGLNALIPLIRLYEPADIRYIIDVMEGGPKAIVSDRDYIEQYVLSGLGVRQQSNQERIFDGEFYALDEIDWLLITERKIEIHFL